MDLRDAFRLGQLIQYVRLAVDSRPYVRGNDLILDAMRSIFNILEKEGLRKEALEEISNWINRLEKAYPEEKKLFHRKMHKTYTKMQVYG